MKDRKLIKVTASWNRELTAAERETRRIVGQEDLQYDEERHPSDCIIDINAVIRCNPHDDEEMTTIEFQGGCSIALLMHFQEFEKLLLKYYGEIPDHTNGKISK